VTRREFITLLSGTAATWPLVARAQQGKRMRRVGALMPYAANDPHAQARNAAFLQGLQQSGWSVGNNVQIDYRWSGGNKEDTRKYAAEREYGIGAKWLELLKQIAPTVTRVAVLRDPAITAGIGLWGAIQSVSPSFGVELRPIDVRDAGEIERALAAFSRSANGGLILTGSAFAIVHRDLIIVLAARYRLPAVYYERFFAAAGGLISYGSDSAELYRLAAGYVDRILKGEKPADLPVQAPTKYDLTINLKTAKALGLTLPQSLLVRADEVIE